MSQNDVFAFRNGSQFLQAAKHFGLPCFNGKRTVFVVGIGHDTEELGARFPHARRDPTDFVQVDLKVRGDGTSPVADLAPETDHFNAFRLQKVS